MGLFDGIRGEFIDIIEWLDPSRDTIVWRFPRHDNEIKMGARLIVRESQTAVFVNEGQVADAFSPGTYTLETRNVPILSTLKGWKHGFDSPFKAEVYFVNTRRFTDFKWGTQNPIIIRDVELGPVRVRAFGGFAARVIEAPRLLRELAGTDTQFRTEEVQEYLRTLVVSKLAAAFAAAEVPLIDLAAHTEAAGERLARALTDDLADVGIEIPQFLIENVTLPPEVERALDKRAQMGIVGNLDQYAKFQAAQAVEQAARNPHGGAGEGLGIGLGMAMGQQMAGAAPRAAQPQAPATPPPLPAAQWYVGVGGERQGPYDQAGLAEQARAGNLTPQSLVWKPGMDEWKAATQIEELAPILSATPPPLPGE
jgi:membrane protease subunit (stomatin/prohibitin family)